jgi:ADP-heptose:LPS heptosyltransferase
MLYGYSNLLLLTDLISRDEIKKILIFKLCCLGDIIFITPAVLNLKYNFPDAKIYYILSPWLKSLYQYLPCNDGIIEFSPPENKNIFMKFVSAVMLLWKLIKGNFDLVLLGHRTNVFGLILALSGIKYRLGFSKTKYINYPADYNENVHETCRYLDVIKSANLILKFEYPVLLRTRNKNDIKKKYELPLDKKIIGIFPFGGINPGTVMPIKRWRPENYEILAEKLINDSGQIQVIFFNGTENDEKIISGEADNNAIIMNISTDVISVCDLIIAGDTGIIHIASAFGVSTLSLFGPSNPQLVAPRTTPEVKHLYIWKKPACSPCYTPDTAIDKNNSKYWKGNEFICHKGTVECMKNIEVEEVFIKVKEILNLS